MPVGIGRRDVERCRVETAAALLRIEQTGLLQGIAGKDEAFVLSLAIGISVIYAGFLVATSAPTPSDAASSRRSTLPA